MTFQGWTLIAAFIALVVALAKPTGSWLFAIYEGRRTVLHRVLGPIENALVGSPIVDVDDPVELGHVARSFDSCLVCTVHAYDGKTGRELSKFVINGMV